MEEGAEKKKGEEDSHGGAPQSTALRTTRMWECARKQPVKGANRLCVLCSFSLNVKGQRKQWG